VIGRTVDDGATAAVPDPVVQLQCVEPRTGRRYAVRIRPLREWDGAVRWFAVEEEVDGGGEPRMVLMVPASEVGEITARLVERASVPGPGKD
jgi:hypothetical protein